MKRCIRSATFSYLVEIREEDEQGAANRVAAEGTTIDEALRSAADACHAVIVLPNRPATVEDIVNYLDTSAPDYGWMVVQVKVNGQVVYGLLDSEITSTYALTKKYVQGTATDRKYRDFVKSNPSAVRRQLGNQLHQMIRPELPGNWNSDFMLVNRQDGFVTLSLSRIDSELSSQYSSSQLKSMVEDAVNAAGLSDYLSKVTIYSDGDRGRTWKSVKIWFDPSIWSLIM